MNEYLISIIMPTYNGESFISESLATIKGQTYKNWELIVVEDGSSERAEEIVKEKPGRAIMRDRKYIPGIRLHLKALKPYLMSFLFREQIYS